MQPFTSCLFANTNKSVFSSACESDLGHQRGSHAAERAGGTTHICLKQLAQLGFDEPDPRAVGRVDDEDDAPRARKVLRPTLPEGGLASCVSGGWKHRERRQKVA